eukprot:840912_1
MTSYAPSELVFTRKIKLPCDLYINHDATHKKDYDTYLKWMIQQQAIIHHNARNASQKYDARRKKTYDLNRKEIPKYKIGDKVLRFVANTKVGNDRKLSESYVGPYKIIQISNNRKTYKIRNIRYGDEVKISLKHIKKYVEPKDTNPPQLTVLQAIGQNLSY